MPRVALILTLLLASAPAVAQVDEARAQTLRESGRSALAEGRIEEAFGLFRVAAEHTANPQAWLELGEVADRLRLDAVAREAYQTFLERLPDASNRADIEGRIRVLKHHLSGGSYAVAEDGHSVDAFVDWNGRPRRVGQPTQNVLVDWQGNPQAVARRPELLSLAEWDGSMHAPRPDIGANRPTRVRSAAPGLGRALSAP